MVIIIFICVLILIAYIFDITSKKSKIPSVIMLLVLGFFVKLILKNLNIQLPDLQQILPILGTLGLILIVLEGSLELELNKSKLPIVLKSIVISLFPILIFSSLIAYYLNYRYSIDIKLGLINVMPLAIISSAIAIPSAKNLINKDKEFVTYESSLSDIFGVIIFNFLISNNDINANSILSFLLQITLMVFVSFLAAVLLAFLLGKIKHHVKFIPIIVLVVLIYTVSKLYHLPALIFILIFGLFISNIDEIKSLKHLKKFNSEKFNQEVLKFTEITGEIAFLIRVLFFILFGFLIEFNELLNYNTLKFSILITAFIFFIRFLFLKLFKMKFGSLYFIAPRGLITILLFLSIPENFTIDFVDKSLILQVIILTSLLMMFGLMFFKKPKEFIT